MRCILKPQLLLSSMVLLIVAMAFAQSQHQRETFTVHGYPEQANVVRSQGHAFVDIIDLARITKGSLKFEQDRIVLVLAPAEPSENFGTPEKAGFSPAFRKAAIEAMASIREWGGMLQVIVENGYPIGKAMAGSTIRAYQGRAADSVGIASSAASTDDDHFAVQLLKNEFNNVQAWSESFIDARNSMRAVDLTTSENGLKDDPEVQMVVRCGQFLAQMFASGSFQDEAACH